MTIPRGKPDCGHLPIREHRNQGKPFSFFEHRVVYKYIPSPLPVRLRHLQRVLDRTHDLNLAHPFHSRDFPNTHLFQIKSLDTMPGPEQRKMERGLG